MKKPVLINSKILRPMSRLGGITYGRLTEGLELPRPDYVETILKNEEAKELIKPKVGGQ